MEREFPVSVWQSFCELLYSYFTLLLKCCNMWTDRGGRSILAGIMSYHAYVGAQNHPCNWPRILWFLSETLPLAFDENKHPPSTIITQWGAKLTKWRLRHSTSQSCHTAHVDTWWQQTVPLASTLFIALTSTINHLAWSRRFSAISCQHCAFYRWPYLFGFREIWFHFYSRGIKSSSMGAANRDIQRHIASPFTIRADHYMPRTTFDAALDDNSRPCLVIARTPRCFPGNIFHR